MSNGKRFGTGKYKAKYDNLLNSTIIRAAEEHGVPSRIVCPSCNGGSTKERSMGLYFGETGQLLATCHRDQCGVGTVFTGWNRLNPHSVHIEQFSQVCHTPTTERLANAVEIGGIYRLSHAFFIRAVTVGYFMKRDARSNRLLLPIYSPEGIVDGVVSRSVPDWNCWGEEHKSLLYKDKGTGMSWYVRPWAECSSGNPPLYIVEDSISAIALWDLGLCSLSLNGTNMNDDRVAEMLKQGYSSWVLALDADAIRTAIKHTLKYTTAPITIRRLVEDIKDMTREEVRGWLEA